MSDSIYADFHVHSHFSPCARPSATAEAMIARAREKGLAAIGFADHFTPVPVPGLPFYDRQRLRILDELRSEIARLAPFSDIEVLVGVEADYTVAGEDCLDPQAVARADHVVCAASHYHLPTAPQPTDERPRVRAELMLSMARAMLHVPGVSIWAHPFACSKMQPLVPIMEAVREEELAALIALANEREVAIEINGGSALEGDYLEAVGRFFGLAREMGSRFTVTADAHKPQDLDRIDVALRWARRAGFRDRDFMTASELLDRQKRRK